MSQDQRGALSLAKKQGLQEGEAGMLLRLIHLKFGELNAAIVDRVQSADIETLVVWSGRILTAQTVEEIFQN